MTSIAAFRSALGRCSFTAAAFTAMDQEDFDTMENISLGTESGFKTMLKKLQERTTVTMEDSTVNNVVTNVKVVVSAHTKKCY